MRATLMFVVACLVFAATAGEGFAQEPRGRVTALDLATITDIDGLSVSPDGRWSAFQTLRAYPQTNSYDVAWYVAPTDGGAPRRIADGGEPVTTVLVNDWIYTHGLIQTPPAIWSLDSQWVIYFRQDKGRVQLWRSRIDGRRTELLTHNEGDVHPGALGGRSNVIPSRDGKRLFFTTRLSATQLAEALADEGLTGFRFDDRFLPNKSSHPLAPPDGGLTSLWVYDFERRSEHRTTEQEAAEYAGLAASPAAPQQRTHVRGAAIASPRGSLSWTEARDPALQGPRAPVTIVAQPAAAKTPVVCSAPVCTGQAITILTWRNDEELLFTTTEPGQTYERKLYSWRPNAVAPPRQVLRTRAWYDTSLWNCGIGQGRLICFYEELTRPRRLVAIDLNSGAIETLYEPNPEWAGFDLGAEPQVIPVRLPSGPQAHSYLVLPPEFRLGHRLPLVIVTYSCGGFLRGGTGDEYPVYALAAQGFAVLCHNILLNDWAGAAREGGQAVPEQIGPNDDDAFPRRVQEGINIAVAELDRMGVIDRDRVAITGLSLGGQTVEYALIHMRLTAAIDSGSHFRTSAAFIADPAGREMFREAGFASPTSQRFQSRAISHNANKISAPLLMNVSDDEFETESITSLQAAGRAAEMYVYPGEFHIKSQPAHRLAIYDRNIDWLNFWLRGVEDSKPGKLEQYARWRVMRDNQCRLFKDDDRPSYCAGAGLAEERRDQE